MFSLLHICNTLFDTAYVFSPVCGFAPQIYAGTINYNPILSLLTIFANILKLFPSKDPVNTMLIYQFCFCIVVHFYLIRAQLSQNTESTHRKAETSPFGEILPNFRSIYRYFIISVFGFVVVLGVLDNLKYTHFFIKAALAIETLVSILQIKLVEKKQSAKILSFVLLSGDIIKTILFIVKFSAPKEFIFATVIQLSVNLYLLFR